MSLRKTLYGEETILVNLRVPISKKDEIKAKFYDVLSDYVVKDSFSLKNNLGKEFLSEELVVVVPEIVEEVIEEIQIEELVETNNYNRVFTLPKDKVLVKLGVYSSGEFFYTTKVISSKLFIYQWNSLEEVDKYLETFK